MEWVLRSPQIHNTFSSLGYAHTDGYHINDGCNAALEDILLSIINEDKYLRAYRRNISFGQNIKKDLIPLLLNAKEDKTIELLIEIFVNLTTPIECLFNVDDVSKTDFGRHTVFEINNLLTATKIALTDLRAAKVVVDFLKKNVECEQLTKLTIDQCRNIGNVLLFLRNILHIPDDVNNFNPSHNGPPHTVQNQILWNFFSQSIDKVLIKLMTVPDSGNWGVTMVQLVALLYKDQHVTTLHKLLNVWLESSLSESSEDNESNTSPPKRGSEDSSPMLTSDPTSDSSDTNACGKCNDTSNPTNNKSSTNEKSNQITSQPADKTTTMDYLNDTKVVKKNKKSSEGNKTTEKKTTVTEATDCGYGTQIENQKTVATSSNEDESPSKKPVHQKPQHPKQRVNNKVRSSNTTVQEKKRRKIVKRGKSNIINVKGLSHNTPTDDDISNVLKEFTVDFLLKGFNSLVKTLHDQILFNQHLEIDTSHFFWLVTYFLKFATQIELDLEHVSSVLSFDIVSYLTAEAVNICEQFDLAIKLDGNDLKPSIRRQHLVVTAIREFVQAIEVYNKSAHMSNENQRKIMDLQLKMCETEELRSLLLLLLRNYNPKYHSKQYLQDLVVTNHILLMFLDELLRLPEYKNAGNMVEHVRQFANVDTMYRYGLLLEDYEGNGEFVNDCVFTVMHHVGGELDSLSSLLQPIILKSFTSILKTEYDICDDWLDLVHYVINSFVRKPHSLKNQPFRLKTECFEDDEMITSETGANAAAPSERDEPTSNKKSVSSKKSTKNRWSEEELSALSWNYTQCKTLDDVVGGIVKMFKEEGIMKSRDSVGRELLKQLLITKEEFEKLRKLETDSSSNSTQTKKEMRDIEIKRLCEQLTQDGKSKFLAWVQTLLLETCNVKIYLEKKAVNIKCDVTKGVRVVEFNLEDIKKSPLPVMSPVSYHSLLFNQSVPLVPWNWEQSSMCKDLRFLQLLHKLGFHMPVDTGKVFIRIPQFWTPDVLYEVAAKIAPIDTTKLKFSVSDISECRLQILDNHSNNDVPVDYSKDVEMNLPTENYYRVHKQKHLATALNYTPTPGCSFNSSNNDMNKSNWLEMVQRSQEYNFNLNLHRNVNEDEDIDMTAATEPKTPNNMECTELGGRAASLPGTILSIPSVMNIRQDSPPYATHLDSECNNSMCETASVASDLTRMYVSDEDDKTDELHDVSLHPLITDMRPRVKFSSPFLSSERILPEF